MDPTDAEPLTACVRQHAIVGVDLIGQPTAGFFQGRLHVVGIAQGNCSDAAAITMVQMVCNTLPCDRQHHWSRIVPYGPLEGNAARPRLWQFGPWSDAPQSVLVLSFSRADTGASLTGWKPWW